MTEEPAGDLRASETLDECAGRVAQPVCGEGHLVGPRQGGLDALEQRVVAATSKWSAWLATACPVPEHG